MPFYETIQKDGVSLDQQPALNVVTDGITLSDDGGNNATLFESLGIINSIADETGTAALVKSGSSSVTRALTAGSAIDIADNDFADNPELSLNVNGLTSASAALLDKIVFSQSGDNKSTTIQSIVESIPYNQVASGGTSLTRRNSLNFGTGFNLSDTGSKTTITLSDSLNAISNLSGSGLLSIQSSSSSQGRSLASSTGQIVVTSNDISLDGLLAALEGYSAYGIVSHSSGSISGSEIFGTTGIGVQNSDSQDGNPTFALNNDLEGIEGISSSGLSVRTGSGTWDARTIAISGAGLAIEDADGVAGNPTISFTGFWNSLANASGTVVLYNKTGTSITSVTTGSIQDTLLVSNGSTFFMQELAPSSTIGNTVYSSAADDFSVTIPPYFAKRSPRSITTVQQSTDATTWVNMTGGYQVQTLGATGTFKAWIYYSSTSTIGMNIAMTTDQSSITGYWSASTNYVGQAAYNISASSMPSSFQVLVGSGSSVVNVVYIEGVVVGNGSTNHTLTFWFKQNVLGATPAYVYPSQCMLLWEPNL